MTSTSHQFPPWGPAKTEFSQPLAKRLAALPCAALRFDPKIWNYAQVVKRFPALAKIERTRYPSLESWYNDKSNCYAYALGDLTLFLERIGGSPHPGVIAGRSFHKWFLTPETVIEAAVSDGLKPTGTELVLGKNVRPVALFMAEREDYHWMRLDKVNNGAETLWTQKFRHAPPCIVVDAEGKPVQDVRTLVIPRGDKTPYKFASFFSVPRKLAIPPDVLERYRENGNPQILRHEDCARLKNGQILVPQIA